MPISESELKKLLTIDFDKKPIVIEEKKKHIVNGVLYLGDSTPIPPWKTPNYRSPWDNIDDSHIKGNNFLWTLNCDPAVEWYENTKKRQIPKLLILLEKLKRELLIQKCIVVYEWGDKGKSHGKLHFHGMLKTSKKDEVVTRILEEFNSRLAISHRTFNIKHVKSVADRDRYLNYMKKETQNKKKCLYYI